MNDLLPGDRVSIAGQLGTVTYASDGHGPYRQYEVKLDNGDWSAVDAARVTEL